MNNESTPNTFPHNGNSGQSASPVSVSVANSVLNTPNVVSDKPSQLNISAPVLEIDQVIQPDNGDMIDVETDHSNTNHNEIKGTNIPPNLTTSPIKELVDNKEKIRGDKIRNIEETLDRMENTRLELAPMLLDIVEQVKNGEVSIKDVISACGRLRVRINKLHEDRTVVFEALSSLEKEFNCSTDEKEQIEGRIANKEQCLSSIADLIATRNI